MAGKTKQKQNRMPAREATEVVLLNAGKPMHYREITRQAIESGLVRVKKGRRKVNADATMKTIRSYLCAEEGDKFVRVGPGVFNLTAAGKRAAKKAQEQKVTVTK